ncbi:FAD-dependent oxidoreductase [Aspergillus lucknowensis]|uniref:FAD-binding domain-containing protein n=1 Tax=Aspergillus lucknowensis TaxID=176173 RepID=A0ABR4LSR1_9EURO
MHRTAQYRVAIVGGGIAGLTLALACERLNISYVLWEAGGSITRDEEASIGLLPNGLRILDQLGVLEDMEKSTAPLKIWQHVDSEGNLLNTIRAMRHYASEYSGLRKSFLRALGLMKTLYGRIQEKDSVHASKRVVSVSSTDSFATIVAHDGSSVTAEVVVGADGVRSRVRGFIDSAVRKPVTPSEEALSTELSCVFGISTPVSGVVEGDAYSLYCEHASVLLFTGKEGALYWFVVEHLGKACPFQETPRYTARDTDESCQSVAHLPISSTACFGDVYKNRITAFKVGLEEGMAPTWHEARAVLVGDSGHKMVPGLAMRYSPGTPIPPCATRSTPKRPGILRRAAAAAGAAVNHGCRNGLSLAALVWAIRDCQGPPSEGGHGRGLGFAVLPDFHGRASHQGAACDASGPSLSSGARAVPTRRAEADSKAKCASSNGEQAVETRNGSPASNEAGS